MQGEKAHKAIAETSLSSTDPELQGQISSALATFSKISKWIVANNVFSDNEIVDEINTTDLKYLLVPYYLGDLYLALGGVEGRLRRVKLAIESLTMFLEQCETATLLSDEDKKEFATVVKICNGSAGGMAPRPTREQKIAAFKKEKERSAKLEALLKKREDFYKRKGTDDAAEEDDVERQYIFVLIESYVQKACDNLRNSAEEVKLLEHREKLQSNPQMQREQENRMAQPFSKPSVYKIDSADALKGPIPDHMKGMLHALPTIDRDSILKQVFREHNPATMSLDQWVDEQQALGLLPTPGQGPSPNMNPNEKKEGGSDDDEPTAEEEEAKRIKDSEWANWTDDNEKGIGQRRTMLS